jgi:hypothetical protein
MAGRRTVGIVGLRCRSGEYNAHGRVRLSLDLLARIISEQASFDQSGN